MVNFGLLTFQTDYALQPDELARWAEDSGFESLFYAEHTHIPTSRRSPFAGGRRLPEYYKQSYDPFLALTAAAAATETLKLGTGICLVTEHDPITLAKTVATLDRLSGGRVLLGIGAGWNAEELSDHGVAFKNRWNVTRERVLAMRSIWTEDVAEYHGEFVDFEPTWSWPKPVQPGGPPVLLGAASRWTPARVVAYCDGWFPIGSAEQLRPGAEALRAEASRAGRSLAELDLTAGTVGIVGPDPFPERKEIEDLIEIGFGRLILAFTPAPADEQRERLPEYERFMQQFAGI